MVLPESELVPLRQDPLLPARPCEVRWKRSARARRVSLRVDAAEGAVVLTLPPRASRKAGLDLLHTHAAWVLQRLSNLAPAIPFAAGSRIPIGGVEHVIRHEAGLRGVAFIEGDAIVITGPPEALPGRAARFLREEALRRIVAALGPHAEALGVRPRAVRVKDTRTRWGSCAPDRTLAFSWRIVLAPHWVLDYVVAHEAAHLREMNHSDRFWALCESRTPHRKAATEWLRKHGPVLLRIGERP